MLRSTLFKEVQEFHDAGGTTRQSSEQRAGPGQPRDHQRFTIWIMALPRLAVEMLASICLTHHD